MTNYLFPDPDYHGELEDRRSVLKYHIQKGNPVSFAMVVWAQHGVNFRPPKDHQIYAMVGTSRGEPEIQGPFRDAKIAADYLNGSDLDSMLFAIPPAMVLEWGETDDKYVLVRVVKPVT